MPDKEREDPLIVPNVDAPVTESVPPEVMLTFATRLSIVPTPSASNAKAGSVMRRIADLLFSFEFNEFDSIFFAVFVSVI